MTVEPADDRTIVTARGEIDVATAPVFRQELMKAQGGPQSDGGGHDVVVDLSGVTFLDARALGVLLAAAMRARRAGTDIVLRNPGRLTLRLLDVTGLGPAFRVERDGGDGSTLEDLEVCRRQVRGASPHGPQRLRADRRRWS